MLRKLWLALVCLGGCTYLSTRPEYQILPVERFTDQLARLDGRTAPRDENPVEREEDPCPLPDGWIRCFMDQAGNLPVWEYNEAAITAALDRVAAGYGGLTPEIKGSLLEEGLKVLRATIAPLRRPGSETPYRRVLHKAREMLKRADLEHPDLLVSTQGLNPACESPIGRQPMASCDLCGGRYPCSKPLSHCDLRSRSNPLMLGLTEPVGVSLTPVFPSGEEKADKKEAVQVVVNNSLFGGGPKKEESREEPLLNQQRFSPVQHVDVALSTVLNSPDTLDRIQYVSTYVYFYPFQAPGHAGADLEETFWRFFFRFHSGRSSEFPPKMLKDLFRLDLERAAEAMRVRIRNVATTVKLADIDSGTVKRTTKDSFTFNLTGSGTDHPEVKGIAPTVGFGSEVGSEATLKLLQQLDQRSTYISPAANFLRITQRGMTAVNLAGRFNEKISLHIPPAVESPAALAPSKDGKLQVVHLSQPLYSRVDALTFSIVVVRHPTELRRTTSETFGLPDMISAADAVYLVGITRPYRVTLWSWDRSLIRIQQEDLLGDGAARGKALLMFGSQDSKQVVHAAGMTFDETLQLLGRMQEEIKKANPGVGAKEIRQFQVTSDGTVVIATDQKPVTINLKPEKPSAPAAETKVESAPPPKTERTPPTSTQIPEKPTESAPK